ncbi:hypothetical protein Moror_12833 [Moniliophthora roreri MCA 2997]|uniref:F-box domain-containing protein n=1 Tax=Moniliophthora roreri (strain MCA 2997) TaxID=1381753 RepID=V2X4M1_MONRO|nr:hypothetical protein Moror_12833 [Moniliophthora roreri MCA 2997]
MREVQIVLCDCCNHTFTARTHLRPDLEQFRSAVPLEAGIAHHHTIIAEEEKELTRFDVELEKLRKIVGNMESERNALQTRISERRNLVSVMRQIPSELWEIIFRHVVVSWSMTAGAQTPSKHSLYVHYDHGCTYSEPCPGDILAPPFILSQVCSHWRSLVLSIPHLWSSISVDIYGLDKDIRPLLEIYYRNSKGRPLTMEIIDSEWRALEGSDCYSQDKIDEFDWDPEQAGRDVFLSLMREAGRCEVLRLDLNEGKTDEEDIPEVSFPILRSFTNLNRLNLDEVAGLDWLLRAVQQAPHLAHVKTRHLRDLPMVPFRHLKSLTIASARGLCRLLMSLTSCPHVDTLDIQDFRRDPRQDQQTGSIVLAAVRSFAVCVNDWEPEQACLLFSSLTIPSLVNLKIYSRFDGSQGSTAGYQHDSWSWQCLYGFLERSSSSLKDLSISISARMFVGGVHILSRIFRLSRSLFSITLAIEENIHDSPPPHFQPSISEMFSKLSIPVPGPSSSPSQVGVPVLRCFHLLLGQDQYPLPKVEIGKDILSFAKSRSKRQVELLGMTNTVLPLVEFSMLVQKSPRCRGLERRGVLPMFERKSEDEDKDLLASLRTLTAGGMRCTIDETLRP